MFIWKCLLNSGMGQGLSRQGSRTGGCSPESMASSDQLADAGSVLVEVAVHNEKINKTLDRKSAQEGQKGAPQVAFSQEQRPALPDELTLRLYFKGIKVRGTCARTSHAQVHPCCAC